MPPETRYAACSCSMHCPCGSVIVHGPQHDPTHPCPAGCHYSSPGYVVYYLMRAHPQLMLRLQNGRFDAPDRLFWSVNDTWRSVTSLPTDVKELIPEFYSTDPTFLLNIEQIDFGCRASGEGWLNLPSWGLLLSSAQDEPEKLSTPRSTG